MAANPHHYWTLDQYVEHERHSGIRHEYVDGQVYAMTGGTIRHGIISGNIFGTLFNKLRGGPCRAFNPDIGVAAQNQRKYFYPDVSVVCGDIKVDPSLTERIANPLVLFEVLSQGTEAYDRTTKFGYYKLITSLQDYVIVEQDRLAIMHYTRSGDQWPMIEYTHLDDALVFASLGVTLLAQEVYQDITWNGLL